MLLIYIKAVSVFEINLLVSYEHIIHCDIKKITIFVLQK